MITVAFALALVSHAALQDAPIIKPGAPGQPATRLTPAEALAMAHTGYLPEDAGFMQDMIVHHGQAVDMGALVAGRSNHIGVQKLAKRIAISQTTEIKMMQNWLTLRGEPIDNPDGHVMGARIAEKLQRERSLSDTELKEILYNTAPMQGMLSPKQMGELADAKGATFDRLWLEGMILHHQGAIFMVNSLMRVNGSGEEPELSEFLAAVLADQAAEISRMKSMLADMANSDTQEGTK